MTRMRMIAVLLALAGTSGGCTTMRSHPTACRAAWIGGSAIVGSLVGALAVEGSNPSSNKHAQIVTGGALAGAVVGALVGIIPLRSVCSEAEASPPPAVAAPPAPPATTPESVPAK